MSARPNTSTGAAWLIGLLWFATTALPAFGASVSNPGFESNSSLPNCSSAPLSYRAALAQSWTSTDDGDPDYYHLGTGNIGCLRFSPIPRTGCAHVGIMVGTPDNGVYREFVQTPIGTLNAFEPVLIRYFVRRVLGTGPTRLGAYLSPGGISTAYGIPADADVPIGVTGAAYVPVELNVTPSVTGSYTLVIGSFESDSAGSNYFYIDDVSVTVCTGLVLGNPPVASVRCLGETAAFSASGSGPGAMTYQWQKLVGASWSNLVNGSRITGASTSVLTVKNISLGDYSLYRCQVGSGCAKQNTTPAGLFSSGPPLAVYRFTTPDRGADLSGRGFKGTLGDVRTGSTETCGGFLHFQPDNNVDEFTIPHAAALDVLGPMTGMAWIRPLGPHSTNDTGGCPEGTIFSKGGNYWFQVGQQNNQLEFQNEGSGSDIVSVPVALPINAWSHVAFVRLADAHTIRFFVNGVFIGTRTLVNPPGSNTDPVMVGNHGSGNSPAYCEFNGDMDEVTLIGRALTDVEVQRASACSCMPASLGPVLTPRLFPVGRKEPGGSPLVLRDPSPSPMRDRTFFEFELDQARQLRLDIFDVAGRHIRTIAPGTGTVGHNTISWDGRDDARVPVGSGVYLYRVTAGDVTTWSRIVVIR